MTQPTAEQLEVTQACVHCKNGWFDDQRFGCDVECVNGILIDIDTAHEGWQKDVAYPVAPCHPMFARQESGDESFPNDCQQRLNEWSDPMIHNMPNEDDINRARLVFAHLRLTKELDREAVERSFMAHRQAAEARMAEAVEAERERCARIADNHSFALDIDEWMKMTKKEISAYACRSVAAAIRSQSNG